MNGSEPIASILVPVRDEERWIAETARAMLGQRLAGTHEVIFLDGRSRDRTADILRELAAEDPRVQVVDNPAGDIPSALNIGLERARGRYVARMDAHSWYPEDYVARGIERLQRGDVAWVTGPAVPRDTGRWARRVAAALRSPLGQGGSSKWAGGDAATDEVELDTGVFAGVWHRETLVELGGWHPDFAVNEDAEMAARVLEGGGRIVCRTDMAAEYAPRDSLRALARQYSRFGVFRVRTSRLHPIALRRSHLASAVLAAMPVAAVCAPRHMRTAARSGLAAYGLAVTAAARRAADPPTPAETAGVAAVFATMHFSWGLGFLWGCVKLGPPWRGIARAVSNG